MDGGAWKAAVHGVAEGRTQLSEFTFTFHFHALEKEMATYSSVLAWRIPGKGEPGGLLSMGSHRVGHGWSDLAAAAAGAICYLFNIWEKWGTEVLRTRAVKTVTELLLKPSQSDTRGNDLSYYIYLRCRTVFALYIHHTDFLDTILSILSF